MSEFLMKPEELIRRIENFGFTMFIGEDGVVHGKAIVPGTKVPLEMQGLLEQLRLQNEAVAEILRNREIDVVRLDGVTQAEAMPWIQRVKAGEYRRVPGTEVIYSRSNGLVSMTLERVK